MEDTRNNENGYERYNRIITYIENQCNESNYVGTIGKSSGSWRERIKKHYVFDGLHVYIDDEETIICDSELYCNNGDLNFQDISYYSVEKIKYSLEKNKRLEDCQLYFWAPERVKPGIRIIYEKNSVYCAEIEDDVKDSCYLPTNVDPKSRNQHPKSSEEGYYSELPADMSILLERAMSSAETTETESAYRDALDFHNRIVKIADRDNKETTVEVWLRRLEEMKDSTPRSIETVNCEQEINAIMNSRGQHRTPTNSIDKDEIELI